MSALGVNKISDVSALANLTGLEELYLQNNNISDISVVANFTALKILYLGKNPINDYSPLDGFSDEVEINLGE